MTTYDPRRYQAVILKSALKLYKDTGMKANTAYTPKNMLATAGKITGDTYKRGEYQKAIDGLAAWLEQGEPA